MFLCLMVNAIAKNSSRTAFDENIGFIPGLIFHAIVRPYSLKTPTYRISLEKETISSHFFLYESINFVQDVLFIFLHNCLN